MSIEFAGKQLPDEAATDHFCFIGSTGSGKTVLIRRLIQSAFPNKIGNGDRAIVYDVKSDMLPILHAVVSNCDLVRTLNPFDSRCYAWDIAQDITEPAHAIEFASILIPPEENSSQPFFSDAARHLLAGLITAFIFIAYKKWTFRDVMFVMFQPELLRTILLATTETKQISDLYFGNEKTTKDIMSTVATKLAPFRLISALWDNRLQTDATAKVSLTEWFQKGFVLVLGNSHTNQASVDAINRVIFKRASQLILDQPETPKGSKKVNKTWMILDEFVRIGKLDGIVQLTTEGRSKGACVVLGFQDINGVRAVYEKEVAEEMIGQCSNLAILKLQSPETAQWSSDFIGLVRDKITTSNTQFGQNTGDSSSANYSIGTQEQFDDRPKVLPSEFRLLPKPTKANPKVVGYFVSDKPPFNQNVDRYEVTGLFSNEGLWEDYSVKGFQPYQDGKKEQRLRIWKQDTDETKDDYKRLKLSKLVKKVEHEQGKRKQKERDYELQEVIQRIKWRGYQTVFDEAFYAQLNEKERETFSRYINNEEESSSLFEDFPSQEELQNAINNQERTANNEDDQ